MSADAAAALRDRPAGVIGNVLSRSRERSAPFLVDGTRRLTYGDLDAETGRIAAALRALDIRPGERVATVLGKSADGLLLALGILRAGAVLVPVDPALPTEVALGRLRRAAPALVVAEDDRAAPWPFRVETAAALAARARAAMPGDDVRVVDTAPAVLLFTSGTTGEAKGVLHSHASLRFTARALAATWAVHRDDVVLHALPMVHAHGLLVAVLPTLWAGASFEFLSRFDVAEVIERLPRATILMGVPFHYARLLASPAFDARATRSVRLAISGSAPLPADLARRYRERTGRPLLERYGTTETLIITANGAETGDGVGTVGPPLDGVAIRLADLASGGPVPPGTAGEVQVRGPNVFAGYLDEPAATRAAFTDDGFFRTGDVGHVDDGGRLVLTGRAKDIIIYCGANVHPATVEGVLRTLPGVDDAAVFPLPHPEFGEVVMAAVVPSDAAPADPAALRQALVGRLAPQEVPKRIVVVGELPRNAAGKVMRSALSARFADAAGRSGA